MPHAPRSVRCPNMQRTLAMTRPPHRQGTLNKTAQWWVPVPEGHKQRFDYWAVVGRPLGNGTKYAYDPDETTLAEGWWTVQVRSHPTLRGLGGGDGVKGERHKQRGYCTRMCGACRGARMHAAPRLHGRPPFPAG